MLVWLGLFGVAVLVAAAVVLPVRTAQVGYDTAASVLYFDRIVVGHRLEAFLSVTPKPLLTVVDGLVHALISDWRAISWLAIVVYGLDVVLAARLVRRLAGRAAAGFAAGALIASSALLSDVALAYAVTWALLGWLIAGTALTTHGSPRYALAGVGLLLAATARFESNLLSVAALVVLAAWSWRSRGDPSAAPPRRAWLLAVGMVALPIQGLHDWLLSGDPLYSLSVPVRGTPSGELLGPFGRLAWLVGRELDGGAMLVLAVAGVAALVAARRWSIVAGLAVLGPGVAAFLVWLEVRHVYVSSRYAAPLDLAIAIAAAVGYGAALAPGLATVASRVRDRFGRGIPASPGRLRASIIVVGVAIVAGAVFASPFGPLSPAVVGTSRSNLTLHANANAAEVAIRATLPTVARLGTAAGGFGEGDDPLRGATVLVPVLLRPQMALDLDLDLTAIVGLGSDDLDPAHLRIHPGQLIYHDRRGDEPDSRFDILESTQPSALGPFVVVPVASDPRLGWWLVRIDQGSG